MVNSPADDDVAQQPHRRCQPERGDDHQRVQGDVTGTALLHVLISASGQGRQRIGCRAEAGVEGDGPAVGGGRSLCLAQALEAPPPPVVQLFDALCGPQRGLGQGHNLLVAPDFVVRLERTKLVPEHTPGQPDDPRLVVGGGGVLVAAQGDESGAAIEPGEGVLGVLVNLRVGLGQGGLPHRLFAAGVQDGGAKNGGHGRRLGVSVEHEVGAVEHPPERCQLSVREAQGLIGAIPAAAGGNIAVVGHPFAAGLIVAREEPVMAHAIIGLWLQPCLDKHREYRCSAAAVGAQVRRLPAPRLAGPARGRIPPVRPD